MNFSCIAVAFTSLYIVRHNPNPQSLSNKLSKINSRKLYIYKILPPLSHHCPIFDKNFEKIFIKKSLVPRIFDVPYRKREEKREREIIEHRKADSKNSLSLSRKKDRSNLIEMSAISMSHERERKRRLPRSLGNLT